LSGMQYPLEYETFPVSAGSRSEFKSIGGKDGGCI
jgi:hypothetical protein